MDGSQASESVGEIPRRESIRRRRSHWMDIITSCVPNGRRRVRDKLGGWKGDYRGSSTVERVAQKGECMVPQMWQNHSGSCRLAVHRQAAPYGNLWNCLCIILQPLCTQRCFTTPMIPIEGCTSAKALPFCQSQEYSRAFLQPLTSLIVLALTWTLAYFIL